MKGENKFLIFREMFFKRDRGRCKNGASEGFWFIFESQVGVFLEFLFDGGNIIDNRHESLIGFLNYVKNIQSLENELFWDANNFFRENIVFWHSQPWSKNVACKTVSIPKQYGKS